jgi:23S rRNA pseudouridine1911/1915/1917 synthase
LSKSSKRKKPSAGAEKGRAKARARARAKVAARNRVKAGILPRVKPKPRPKIKVAAAKAKAGAPAKPKAALVSGPQGAQALLVDLSQPQALPKPAPKPAAKIPAKAPAKGRGKALAPDPLGPELLRIIAPGGGRERLDKVLAAELKDRGLSRSRVQQLLDEGRVTVNGEQKPARFGLKGGESLELRLPAQTTTDLKPADIKLKVLYEDEHLVVVDKPAGLVTHPGAGHSDDTLANALLFHAGAKLRSIGGIKRPGIVHRLDKDTTGCLVAAKSEAAFTALQSMIARREVTRLYLALVWGDLRENSGTIDAPIGRGGDRMKMALRAGGKPAVTHFTVRERFPHAVELECKLETGRTHQIRAHLAGIGHPVVGDPTYGRQPGQLPMELRAGLQKALQRQALHAWKLQFKHPITGKLIQAEAKVPADYVAARALLKKPL